MQPVTTKHRVNLVRSGQSQVILIPKELELEGSEVTICRSGNSLIVEPVTQPSLLEVLETLQPLDESLEEINDSSPSTDINL